MNCTLLPASLEITLVSNEEGYRHSSTVNTEKKWRWGAQRLWPSGTSIKSLLACLKWKGSTSGWRASGCHHLSQKRQRPWWYQRCSCAPSEFLIQQKAAHLLKGWCLMQSSVS